MADSFSAMILLSTAMIRLPVTNSDRKTVKKFAVQGFHSMGLKVAASGDSYNDLSMINEADGGVLFCPPEQIVS